MTRLSRLALVAAVATILSPAIASAAKVHVGSAFTVEQATPIATLLAEPDKHAGEVVRVEGEVTGVCKAMGCWMEIADADGRSIKIKVEDGVLVFPADATGKPASAEGKVTLQSMPREEYVKWQRHLAEDAGEAFDEAKIGAGPFTVVELQGTGADVGE